MIIKLQKIEVQSRKDMEMIDITDQIDGEYVQFHMADAGSPTILRNSASEANGVSALYVLMPMRV